MRGALLLSRIGLPGRIALAVAVVATGTFVNAGLGAVAALFAFVPIYLTALVLLFVYYRRVRAAGPMSAADRAAILAGWRARELPGDLRQANALLKLAGITPANPSAWLLPVVAVEGLVVTVANVVDHPSVASAGVSGGLALLWLLAGCVVWRREVRSRPLREQARQRWIPGYSPADLDADLSRRRPPDGWPRLAPGADPWAPPGS